MPSRVGDFQAVVLNGSSLFFRRADGITPVRAVRLRHRTMQNFQKSFSRRGGEIANSAITVRIRQNPLTAIERNFGRAMLLALLVASAACGADDSDKPPSGPTGGSSGTGPAAS